MNYCRSLNFEDKPCISDLRRLFKNLMKKQEMEYDYGFDWVNQKVGLKELPSADDEEKDPDYKDMLKKALFEDK